MSLAEPSAAESVPLSVTLTPRELTVLRELLRDGRGGNEQIASRLFLSVDTVKTHIKSILRKTRTESRMNLAVSFFRRDVMLFDPLGRVIEP